MNSPTPILGPSVYPSQVDRYFYYTWLHAEVDFADNRIE